MFSQEGYLKNNPPANIIACTVPTFYYFIYFVQKTVASFWGLFIVLNCKKMQ